MTPSIRFLTRISVAFTAVMAVAAVAQPTVAATPAARLAPHQKPEVRKTSQSMAASATSHLFRSGIDEDADTDAVSSAPSLAFRNGVDDDALACTQWTAGKAVLDASPLGFGCAAEHLQQLCADAPGQVVPRLAEYLQTSPFNVLRALSRYNIVNEEKNESLCDVGGSRQPELIAFTRPKRPPGSPSEQNPDRLLKSISRSDRSIDAGAYARAVGERFAIIAATSEDPNALAGLPTTTGIPGSAEPGLKTAGLPADASGWTNLTGYLHPVGRVNDLLIDSSGTPDSRTLWAGTDGGGIWKSTNNGSTWSQVNDKLGSLVIGRILQSPVNAQVMYASTNPLGSHSISPYGIIKSTDGGVTWSQLAPTNPNTNPDFLHVTHLAIHPAGVAGQDVLLAATNRQEYKNGQAQGGIYLSEDSGATWSKISADIAGAFVVFHPADGNRRAYALMSGAVFVTSTGTFGPTPASSVVSNTKDAYTKLAWSASNPEVMYALAKVYLSPSQNVTRLFRSTTGGSSWTQVAMPGTMYNTGRSLLSYTGAVWVDPTNPNRVVAAEVWAGSTADVTTASATAGWKTSATGWADFHGIVHDPGYNGTTNKIIYMMDDGGLYRYSDVDGINSFANGTILATGMTISETYSVAGRGGNLIFGAQDVNPRVYRTGGPTDPALKWRTIAGPGNAPINGDGAATAASRTNPNVLYGSKQYLDIYRSDDGGATAVSICGSPPNRITEGRCEFNFDSAFIAPFVLDPNNDNTLWAGASSLWRTNNATASPPSWIRAHTIGDLNWVTAIDVAAGDSNVVWFAYGGFGQDLYKSVNATAASPTFTLVPATGLGDNHGITRILIDRTNTQNVWVGLEGSGSPRLYFSNNGGTTFTAVNGLPHTTVFALAQHPANPAWIYAGTLVGLFASQNYGKTWGASNEGPGNVSVRDLSWYSESGQSAVLLAATFGRGVWKTTVVSSTPSLVVVKSGSGSGAVTGLPWGIDCGSDCNESFGEPTAVTLMAAPDAGSVFTGWLGACKGTSLTCNVDVSSATRVGATFAPGITVPKVDVDGEGSYNALTDGLLILRHLFGLSGTQLTANALGTGATRSTPAEIAQHIVNVAPGLDVDGNGQVDALTDGLILIRYMFGLRGTTLVNGAIGPGATRTTPEQVEAYITSVLQ